MFFIGGCGNSLSCALLGDNVRGRINFAPSVPIESRAPLVVEWSTDSFATAGISSSKNNEHDLLTVPYTLCVDNNKNIQFRAYQDRNGNRQPDAGETAGRYDGTPDGNAGFITKNVPSVGSASSSTASTWEKISSIDITLDGIF